jgi:catechol 2,3-dioxygenase-like lactoylglutathione lyase family enzyme
MRLTGIDHVALSCASVATTKAWYVDVLGFEHVFAGEWESVPVFLKLGATYLALFPLRGELQPSPQRPGFNHLAFNAATHAEFAEAQADLAKRGIEFEFQDHGISHSIYFDDPDGRPLEITTYDVPSLL